MNVKYRISMLFLVILVVCNTVIAETYPTEIIDNEELVMDVIPNEKIVLITEEKLDNIILSVKRELEKNPNDVFQNWMFNLYDSFDSVGEPKLIFNEERAIFYIIPLLLNSGNIGGFIVLDPYDGNIISYPGWSEEGFPSINENIEKWNNLEENLATSLGLANTEGIRIIAIRDSPFRSTTYITVPDRKESANKVFSVSSSNENQDILRIDLSNYYKNGEILFLNQTPKKGYEPDQTMQKIYATAGSNSGEPIKPPDEEEDLTNTFLISQWKSLPKKNQRSNGTWANYVNSNLEPIHAWDNGNKVALKCLSYAASTVADWWFLQLDDTLGSYTNFVRGETEQGNNPRELESIFHYYYATGKNNAIYDYGGACIWPVRDPVTGECIPYNLQGYADVLTDPPNWINRNDPELPNAADFKYNVNSGKYKVETYINVDDNTLEGLKESIRKYGIIYSQLDWEFAGIPFWFGIHTVPIIGYGKLDDTELFIYQDSYGEDYDGEGDDSTYKVVTVNDVDEAWAFKTALIIPLQGYGTTVHSCSGWDSVNIITGVTPSDWIPNTGDNINLTINWNGWHWNDENHWAFFLGENRTLIGTCKSNGFNNGYDSNDPYDMYYAMICQVTIPEGTPSGQHALTVTGDDVGGYCEPGETGVDAQQSITITITGPSCSDSIQNGDETGIDCGGSCVTEDEEFCNGVDDDHDCDTDENLQRDCSENYLGNCAVGIETCNLGIWQGCPVPQAETCDGQDEDCDGVLDGSESLTQQCGSSSIGICTYGTETCDDDGNWINCNAIFPQEEICNNSIDENCDGFDEPCPIYCTINLPQNNNYGERRIPFNITLLEENEYLKYIDYADNRPRESTLCRRCDGYGSERARHKTFSDGYHDISIFTTDGLCNESVEFFVDSKEPIISKTEPRRGFTDGNFYVEFTEDYPESLILTYGNSFKNESVDLNTCYEAGRRIACDVNVNLDEFEGKEINYWFTLVDIAGNSDESRINTLEVDQTDPKINYLNFDIDRRRVTFNISITEKNFDYVEYLDNEDRIPRWRTLCSRLKDDVCLKTKSFRSGFHDLSFNVTDEAGNYVIPDNIAFTII